MQMSEENGKWVLFWQLISYLITKEAKLEPIIISLPFAGLDLRVLADLLCCFVFSVHHPTCQQMSRALFFFYESGSKKRHFLLLSKLDFYGIRNPENHWFRSYLSNRKQRVFVNGTSSDLSPIVYGVPQCTIIGTSLFLTYLNDFPQASNHFSEFWSLIKRILFSISC